MVYLSTLFFLSTIFLSTRISFLLASSGKCCGPDKTCSGCWMCPESDLGACWDGAVKQVHSCSDYQDMVKKVDCLCKAYGKLAFCWSRGRCCTEYSPTLAAATNLCNLATYPPEHMDLTLAHKAKEDAHWVSNTIYNNNSGKDVPILNVYVQPFSGPSNSTYYSPQQEDHYASTHTQHKDKSSANLQGSKSPSELQNNGPSPKKQQQEYSSVSKYKPQQEHQSYTSNPMEKAPHKQWGNHKSPTHFTSHDSGKFYHHGTCSRKKHKCQKQVASQYHQARRHQSSKSHVKRAQSPLVRRTVSYPTTADLFKRSEVINDNGETECGIDFQHVKYPSYVPESVAQVFATL